MDVKKVAKLANLTISDEEENKLSSQFEETLKTISIINELDTANIDSVSQVIGLVNVMRKDEIDKNRMLNIGDYFKVKAIFNAQ